MTRFQEEVDKQVAEVVFIAQRIPSSVMEEEELDMVQTKQ